MPLSLFTPRWKLWRDIQLVHALNHNAQVVTEHLTRYLMDEPPSIELAVEGLERAIDALYPHTQFHQMCHDMYLKVVGGELTLEEEETLKKLGLKF